MTCDVNTHNAEGRGDGDYCCGINSSSLPLFTVIIALSGKVTVDKEQFIAPVTSLSWDRPSFPLTCVRRGC